MLGDEEGQPQLSVDLAFGAALLAGFAVMLWRMHPAAVAFEVGLAVGYLLHVTEKMLAYDRVLGRLRRGRRAEGRTHPADRGRSGERSD